MSIVRVSTKNLVIFIYILVFFWLIGITAKYGPGEAVLAMLSVWILYTLANFVVGTHAQALHARLTHVMGQHMMPDIQHLHAETRDYVHRLIKGEPMPANEANWMVKMFRAQSDLRDAYEALNEGKLDPVALEYWDKIRALDVEYNSKCATRTETEVPAS